MTAGREALPTFVWHSGVLVISTFSGVLIGDRAGRFGLHSLLDHSFATRDEMEITNQTAYITNDSQVRQRPTGIMTAFQQWLQHPERFWVRKALFQIHLWVGAGVGLYVVLMSLTGSIIVFRNELSGWLPIEWLVKLHENLLLRGKSRFVNGIRANGVTTVCF